MKKHLFSELNIAFSDLEKNAFKKKNIEEIKSYCEEFMSKDTPAVKLSLFEIFHKTGSRYEYETAYFEKRAALNGLAILSLAFPYEEKWIHAYEDVVWAICDEFTWALPAHINQNTPAKQMPYNIDLFAAETGFALSESMFFLKNRLSPLVYDRANYELNRRIINPFLNNRFAWEKFTSNWAAVCGGSVGAVFLYSGTESQINAVIPRIIDIMYVYLSSLADDGTCSEGYLYWKYGFSFFSAFAELLLQYTDGKTNLFDGEKVYNAAHFQEKALLSDGFVISFSDCGQRIPHLAGLSHFLGSKFGVSIPNDTYAEKFIGTPPRFHWAQQIRDFAWVTQSNIKNPKHHGTYYLSSGQWFIKKTSVYDFAAKAGHNSEEHNHNDVGSFLINSKGNIILSDLGSGEYTKPYFDYSEGGTRYTFLTTGSHGHSVPIISGEYQKAGKKHAATSVIQQGDIFSFNMADAYSLSNLKHLIRTFTVSDSHIEISDDYSFTSPPEFIVERFVTQTKPYIKDDFILIGNARLYFNSKMLSVNIIEKTYKKHNLESSVAYLIDFSTCEPIEELMLLFRIEF